MWPFSKKIEIKKSPKRSAFSTHLYSSLARDNEFKGLNLPQPTINGVAMDSIDSYVPSFKGEQVYGVPESQASWYASQMFIGNNMCAVIAKHWLVDKACNMPARDAIRQGYDIDCDNDDDRAISKKLRKRDKKYRITHQLKELVHFGRVYGGRLALFVVETSNPKEWYENPFNIDGVTKGMYKGIKQIDPQWVTPDLTDANVQDPASMDFYEPTYYVIGGRKYHKSHFIKFVPFPVPNVLKPLYNYFGVSVPERIYERVYASERTANEAPQLAMTKRLLTIGMADVEGMDELTIRQNILEFIEMRDNYGVQTVGKEDVVQQFDTSLADLDATIMTQYQLVASASNVPATKLLGTTPKGFNSTGEYEEANYREELESIQSNDLEELLQRHYDMLMRSDGLPVTEISITWAPLDSPTAVESADIELKEAQTDVALASTGAIDGLDIRKKTGQQ
ncbi:phage-associated protein, HI1409 family [Proteus mirabilis]|uniref:Phage-associated protein, HI1409 family n=1 Tax=Proteus mirabilis TaxID=584 RepID=A0A2X2DF66_PROMI|nr:phage-associated protein, HI1409 family [Proteus mirabilis]